MAVMTFDSPSGSKSSNVTDGRPEGPATGTSSGATRSGKRRSTISPVARRVVSRYSDQAPPRSGRSTRWRNDGMTLRSSSSIRSAYWRASGSG